MSSPYDEGLLCEDCAEAEYIRFWVEQQKPNGRVSYYCPPDCPFFDAGQLRLSVGSPRPSRVRPHAGLAPR
jgi:hypothetical protein